MTRGPKSARVKWGEPQKHAFATLKKRLASAPILRLLELSKPFILHMDSSGVSIPVVLMQDEAGLKHPVYYASRKLQPKVVAYSTIEVFCTGISRREISGVPVPIWK